MLPGCMCTWASHRLRRSKGDARPAWLLPPAPAQQAGGAALWCAAQRTATCLPASPSAAAAAAPSSPGPARSWAPWGMGCAAQRSAGRRSGGQGHEYGAAGLASRGGSRNCNTGLPRALACGGGRGAAAGPLFPLLPTAPRPPAGRPLTRCWPSGWRRRAAATPCSPRSCSGAPRAWGPRGPCSRLRRAAGGRGRGSRRVGWRGRAAACGPGRWVKGAGGRGGATRGAGRGRARPTCLSISRVRAAGGAPGGFSSHLALITSRAGCSMRPLLRMSAAPAAPYCASSMLLQLASRSSRLQGGGPREGRGQRGGGARCGRCGTPAKPHCAPSMLLQPAPRSNRPAGVHAARRGAACGAQGRAGAGGWGRAGVPSAPAHRSVGMPWVRRVQYASHAASGQGCPGGVSARSRVTLSGVTCGGGGRGGAGEQGWGASMAGHGSPLKTRRCRRRASSKNLKLNLNSDRGVPPGCTAVCQRGRSPCTTWTRTAAWAASGRRPVGEGRGGAVQLLSHQGRGQQGRQAQTEGGGRCRHAILESGPRPRPLHITPRMPPAPSAPASRGARRRRGVFPR